MRVVCLSDTHNTHGRFPVPAGDLLLHAGDFSMNGREAEIRAFDDWLGSLPHPHKVVVAGNHDRMFEVEPARARALITNAIYLEDGETTVEGLRIWGSPWQPWFYDWAFNLPRGPALAEKWGRIPSGLAVLITHGPPAGILDRTPAGERVGCADLRRELDRVRPRLHVFGHIHDAHGTHHEDGAVYVNASICDEAYLPTHPAIVVDL